MVEVVRAELERREILYSASAGFPDDLDEYNASAAEPLAPLLVILDEYNTSAAEAGGPRGAFASGVAQIARTGRKYGVHVVFAAQEFSLRELGSVRRHAQSVFAFHTASRDLARSIGCAGAHLLHQPGRAVTNRWSLVQTYRIEKTDLVHRAAHPAAQGMAAAALAREDSGRVTIPWLVTRGMGEWQARKLLASWRRRGWLQKDRRRDNAHYITARARADLGLEG